MSVTKTCSGTPYNKINTHDTHGTHYHQVKHTCDILWRTLPSKKCLPPVVHFPTCFQMLCININQIICLEHFDIRGRMLQVFNSFSENTCSILWNTLPPNQTSLTCLEHFAVKLNTYVFVNFSINKSQTF